jgi:hypothetical protein
MVVGLGVQGTNAVPLVAAAAQRFEEGRLWPSSGESLAR